MRNSLHKALKRKNLDSERCLVEPGDTVDSPDKKDIPTAPDQPVGKNKNLRFTLLTESSPEKSNKKNSRFIAKPLSFTVKREIIEPSSQTFSQVRSSSLVYKSS